MKKSGALQVTRHNYIELIDRFTHIDGEIRFAEARMCCGENEASARIVLSVYPWWEHPQYLAALASGANWSIKAGADAARDLVIEAVRPHVCELTGRRSATDLEFTQEDPRLWQFEDEAAIVINSEVDHALLFDAV